MTPSGGTTDTYTIDSSNKATRANFQMNGDTDVWYFIVQNPSQYAANTVINVVIDQC